MSDPIRDLVPARSPRAARALALVEHLQHRLVERLEAVSRDVGVERPFEVVRWLRDGGRHGGGARYCTADTPVFDRASVNTSGVHYDDEPDRKLSSATALSTIVHPRNPRAPSVHMHFSWTETRDGRGYWRMMADLNPSHPDPAETAAFADGLRRAAPEHYDDARAQGDRYFYIPALGRHRGATHFYLEGHDSGDWEADAELARRIGEAGIDTYARLLAAALATHPAPTADERAHQRAYHTLYLFQVLTLDRGTTSGLLIHDQNDVGILGSLPGTVDRTLLASWRSALAHPQDELLSAIVAALPDVDPCVVDDRVKVALAGVVRAHYRAHPEALAMQATGDVVPPTVDNHR